MIEAIGKQDCYITTMFRQYFSGLNLSFQDYGNVLSIHIESKFGHPMPC